MNNYCSIQEKNDFTGDIFDLIQEYLDSKECYPEATGLSINSETLELTLCIKSECDIKSEWCPIDELISTEDQIPDCDNIYDLASTFCFIE